jgi:hypothetical protein
MRPAGFPVSLNSIQKESLGFGSFLPSFQGMKGGINGLIAKDSQNAYLAAIFLW